jgi:hypothetical protein
MDHPLSDCNSDADSLRNRARPACLRLLDSGIYVRRKQHTGAVHSHQRQMRLPAGRSGQAFQLRKVRIERSFNLSGRYFDTNLGAL